MAKTNPAGPKKKAVQAIKKAETFFLTGHVRPDGDCIGSALALRLALKRLGKRADVYSRDPLPENLRDLPGAKDIVVGKKVDRVYDVAIFLECSTPDRAGGMIDHKRQAKVVLNFDSHLRTQKYGDVNVIEPDISSTAEQVYHLLKDLKVKLDKPIATCLYVGLVTDTGRFHYSNTSPEALRFASELLEAGVEATKLNDRLFATHPFEALKLLGRAMDKLRLSDGGRVALLPLSAADFAAARAHSGHTEDLVNYGIMVPGVEVSAILKEEPAGIRVSLRARGTVDVSAIAALFGGGGHANAAGCTLHGDLAGAEARLLDGIRKKLSARKAAAAV